MDGVGDGGLPTASRVGGTGVGETVGVGVGDGEAGGATDIMGDVGRWNADTTTMFATRTPSWFSTIVRARVAVGRREHAHDAVPSGEGDGEFVRPRGEVPAMSGRSTSIRCCDAWADLRR